MKIAVLGSGVVGRTLAEKLVTLGHSVVIGTRDVDALMAQTDGGQAGSPFSAWIAEHGEIAVAPYGEAATNAELFFNATNGAASIDALTAAGAGNLAGKIMIDVSNPLDFSAGFPPTFTVANTDSLAEQIQRAFPEARVVKSLNTVTAMLMVNPDLVDGGEHHMFVAGNDADAKAEVMRLLNAFGWRNIIDLGDITCARPMEMYLAMWVRLFMKLGPMFNVRVVTAGG